MLDLSVHPAPPLLIDRLGAAHALSVSPATIDRLRRAGEIPYLKLGTRTLFDPADLARWRDQHKQRAEVAGVMRAAG